VKEHPLNGGFQNELSGRWLPMGVMSARYDLMFFWMTSTMSRAKGHLGGKALGGLDLAKSPNHGVLYAM
jgi:hypothetical protein